MAKGSGYEMAKGFGEIKAAETGRDKLEVLCPLCGHKMLFDSMANAWFCYAAETPRGTEYCPGWSDGPDYREQLQGQVIFSQADAQCWTVRGRGGKTNIRVDGNPKSGQWEKVSD